MPEISGLYLQGDEEAGEKTGEQQKKRERVHRKENQYITFSCFNI